MTAARWLVLAGLVGFLVSLQHFVIEETPEKKQEAVYTNIKDLPPGDMVPTYVGSLFLGSFRAVAIDVLWIQLQEAQDSGRWYLAREISEMISHLQPHNEEVWAMLSHDAAYNVAEGERIRGDDKAWPWVRYGLLMLRNGIKFNPKSVYLRNQLGYFLWHKPSWRTGQLDLDLLARIEADDELQIALQNAEDREPTEAEKAGILRNRKSSFELAILWLQESIRFIGTRRDLFSQMGLALREDTMDGFVRNCIYLQGVYHWERAKASHDSPHWELAKAWFLRARDYSSEMYRKHGWALLKTHAEFYGMMPEVLDASRAFTRVMDAPFELSRSFQIRYVRALERMMTFRPEGPLDDGYLLRPLRVNRTDLSREAWIEGGRPRFSIDENEYNDIPALATRLYPQRSVWGNLRPRGDVDVYVVYVQEDDGHGHAQFQPHLVKVLLQRTGGQALEIRATMAGREVEKKIVAGDQPDGFDFAVARPGPVYFEVRPAGNPDELPYSTQYGIVVDVEE